MSCGVGHRGDSDPTLLWVWCRLAATTLIRPLPWEPLYAVSTALRRQKNKQTNKQMLYGLHLFMFVCVCICMFYLFNVILLLLLFWFLGPKPWHVEVPRLEVQSELQLPGYTTATAMRNLSCTCNLYHSSPQCWILNLLSQAKDWTCIFMDTSQICTHCSTGTSVYVCFRCVVFFYLWMVLPKLIYKELYLIGLELSTYKLSTSEVLRNLMKLNPNAFQFYRS